MMGWRRFLFFCFSREITAGCGGTNFSCFNLIFVLVSRLFLRAETLPERIYNSHYGNGLPAMFTF